MPTSATNQHTEDQGRAESQESVPSVTIAEEVEADCSTSNVLNAAGTEPQEELPVPSLLLTQGPAGCTIMSRYESTARCT